MFGFRNTSASHSPLTLLLLLLMALLSAATAGAQERVTPTARKPVPLSGEAARSASTHSPTRLEQCRHRFLNTLAQAELELRKQKELDPAECLEQLRCKELASEVACDPPNLARLQELTHCLYGNSPALEQPAVIRLRAPLAEYIQAVRLAENSNLPAAYRWHFDRLKDQLTADQATRDEDILRRHVAWMHWLDEAPEIARQARKQATYPNFVVAVRKDLLQPHLQKLNKDVKETKFASHVIVGAQVTGQVHAQGAARPQLDFRSPVPKLRIYYAGTSHSPSSNAVSGPVTIRNRGVTTIDAHTDIYWDGRYVVAAPTVANCKTKITQLGISINRPRIFSGRLVDRIIENTALQQASERRAQAERESSELTRRDVTARMDAEVAEFTALANEQYEKFFVKPATRVGVRPFVQLASTQNYVTFGLTQFDAAHMAADRPPSWEPMEGRAVVCIHQSALTGFTQKPSGGALWHDNDFSDLQRQVMGIRSAEIKVDQKRRWALQLDWLQPFSTRIDAEGIQFTIRARSITYNGKTLTCPIRIDAKYQLKPSATTLHGLRQGEVRVVCLSGAEGSPAVRERVANFLEQKFSGFFQEHVYLDGITIPTGESWDSLKTFFVREVQSHSGWLYLAIDHKEADATRLVGQELELLDSE